VIVSRSLGAQPPSPKKIADYRNLGSSSSASLSRIPVCRTCFLHRSAMAAENFKLIAPEFVFFEAFRSKQEAQAFAQRLFAAVHVRDYGKGYETLSSWLGVPAGSVLMWPHLRFSSECLQSGRSDSMLLASMKSHFGKMRKDGSGFSLCFDIGTSGG
jgi:hypothetical protein